MVRVSVIKENNNYKKIVLKGHSNYDEIGKDIVCAAISATYLCTVNAILRINSSTIDLTRNNDEEIINIIKQDNITNSLLDNMISCLKEIEKNYPENIKIK